MITFQVLSESEPLQRNKNKASSPLLSEQMVSKKHRDDSIKGSFTNNIPMETAPSGATHTLQQNKLQPGNIAESSAHTVQRTVSPDTPLNSVSSSPCAGARGNTAIQMSNNADASAHTESGLIAPETTLIPGSLQTLGNASLNTSNLENR